MPPRIFDTTFVLVLVLTAAAGADAAVGRPPARRRVADEAGELAVETAPLDDIGALLLDVSVPPASRLAGSTWRTCGCRVGPW